MALLHVLMSPLYNFTADDIARLRMKNAVKPLFSNLETCDFLNDWRRWSAYSKNHGARKLIRTIYNEGGFNPLAAGSLNPEKTMINIRLLLYYAESLVSLTKDSLLGLAEVLSGRSSTALEEARFAGEDTERVKLMTIHAAKGLEFPICFVARTNSRFNLRENYSDIITSDKIGLAMRYIIPETLTRCDTLLHRKAREDNQAAAVSEEMRKLYVACTRARDKLILTAALKEAREPVNNSYLNWLLKTDIRKKILPASEIKPATEKKEQMAVYKNETQEIINATERIYPREPLTKIPRRFTATQVSIGESPDNDDKMQDEPTIFPRGASFMKGRRLTGKKRGDAYHKMMELLDFKAGDYEAQFEALRHCFTEEEINALEPEKIKNFFTSPLGKRAALSPKVQKEFKLCTELHLSELGYPEEYDELFDDRPFVQGIADMFFFENDAIILVDYKTNRNTSPENLVRQYRRQLEIYARAIEEMTGSRVLEKWIYSFELGEIKI
jgi:ATP-dependent helicase/nuclease subunit A